MRQYTVTEYEQEDYDYFKRNLTSKKAIEFLEIISRGYLPDYNFTGTEDDFDNYCIHKAIDKAIKALEEIQQYREIGTVEECREAVEKLKRAEEALNVILSGNYNDECNFCVHNDNPMANCQCICGDGSWCIHNAKWNGKTSEDENLEGMEDV